MVENVIIMGAAGRDFHNFNVCFRDNPRCRVAAFTAAQIPNIEGRIYPPELAGVMYPQGIPIYSEDRLVELIRQYRVDRVVFSYSDIPHIELMHRASRVLAENADFTLIGARRTMLRSVKPVVSICAVRTGCGKSQTTRWISLRLRAENRRVVVVRHPMPYGDLRHQEVQRFASFSDFERFQCTIEEREEYEPLVDRNMVVYAGIDYRKILTAAEKEADIILWDGGNNDTPFFYPDVHIVLFDPHRAGHERQYYPGETNMRMADIAVIHKVNTASSDQVAAVRSNIEKYASQAEIVLAESIVKAKQPERITGRRVLVIEDGPTLTHGGMAYGAGIIAARRYQAAEIVDPRPYAVGTLAETYRRYPHIDSVVPAMGYSREQIGDLEKTIDRVDCDLVVFATPVRLSRILFIRKPTVRVTYEYRDHGRPDLETVLMRRLKSVLPEEVRQ